jgi:NAD(P)-dependent dehydrogenase (short-subunit alcohol dehydrogenase family)
MPDTPDITQYQARDNLLHDRIIVVTGAGDGIGRAVALACAKVGATVVLVGRTLSKLEKVYDEIEQASGPQPAIYPINFEGAVEQDYANLAAVLNSEFGRVDGLLHNASELGSQTPIALYDSATWSRVMQVNVTAPFMLTKALIPLLEKSDAASVVFTSSTVGRKGRAYWGAYAVSKGATENLMQTFADELDGVSTIRANSINPGATRTKMRATAYPAEDPATVTAPEAITAPYLYLLGPDSKGVNGQQVDAQPRK